MTGTVPLAIELANTTYAVRGVVQDGLRTVGELAAWLDRVSPRASGDRAEPGGPDLAAARALRDAIRAVARSIEDGLEPVAEDLDTINLAARAAPHWTELRPGDPPRTERRRETDGPAAVLAEAAENAITLFAGEDGGRVRLCGRPGCVLLFVKDHPRREWCSNKCGNTVRAARHYRRTREG